jgi:hypothetical protein
MLGRESAAVQREVRNFLFRRNSWRILACASRCLLLSLFPEQHRLHHASEAHNMPERPLPARAQTLKQAKQAFKARGSPAISEQEKRQLDRSIELERRAWRARELEKKKAEAAKKRTEKEKREGEERAKVHLGTQRLCDRYGHKASQMHLGAFLNRNAAAREPLLPIQQPLKAVDEMSDDSFGDSGLDDETLLEAFGSIKTTRKDEQPVTGTSLPFMRQDMEQDGATHPANDHGQPALAAEEDFSLFFDDLESGTQIARELSAEESEQQLQRSNSSAGSLSFHSGEFDLTAEEFDQLEAVASLAKTCTVDTTLMPPPPLPNKHATFTVSNGGFTFEELESFVDDDLQLTQADPG